MSEKGFQPTPSQQKAITASNRSVIVSAAAGSGKTRVLVERYIRLLADGFPPEKILVITFTRKAAAQLKERTMRELFKSAEPEMKLLAPRVAVAPISTIHSFCSQLIREFSSMLGLDPSFATLEEDVAADMMERAFRRISAKYARSDELRVKYEALLRLFGSGRDDSGLKAMVFELFEFLRTLPDPDTLTAKWLASYENASNSNNFAETDWGRLYIDAMQKRVDEFKKGLNERINTYGSLSIPVKWQLQLSDEMGYIAEILQSSPDIDAMLKIADGEWVGKRMPSKKPEHDPRAVKWKDEWKEFRDSVVKTFAGDWLTPPAELLADLKRFWAGGSLQFLKQTVDEFGAAYAAFKKNANALDFSDLERQAYKLIGEISGGEVAVKQALETRFTHILMDEYQDTNPLQDAIVDSLSAGEDVRVFRVGDVKQSIYRFRHAEPDLFEDRYNASEDDESENCLARSIDLADNFRSALPIVAFVNETMRRIMTRDFGGAMYAEGHELRHMFGSIQDDPEYGAGLPAVSISLVADVSPEDAGEGDDGDEGGSLDDPEETGDGAQDEESAEELDRTRREAALIAKEIMALTSANPPVQVYEESGGKLIKSNLKYGHITILLSAVVNSTNAYAEVFEACGIPLWGTGRDILTDEPVIRDVISLLEIIDNPIQDIPLAACLLGTACGAAPDAVYLLKHAVAQTESLFDALQGLKSGLLESRLSDAKSSIESATDREVIERGLDAVREFACKLEIMQRFALSHTVPEAVRFALERSGILAQASVDKGGHALKRIEWIMARAQGFESHKLPQFVQFLKRQFQIELPVGGVGDSVQLMSIHQAKGLEFPVVFLGGLGKKFNLQDVNTANILFDREYGFGCKVLHKELPVRYPSATYKVVQENAIRRQLEEELRKLYVGMTRARERLYLVGTVRQTGFAKLAARRCGDGGGLVSEREKSRSFTDFIIPCLMDSPGFVQKLLDSGIELPGIDECGEFGAEFETHIVPGQTIDEWFAQTLRTPLPGESAQAASLELSGPVSVENLKELVPDIVAAEYGYIQFARIPSKIGASTLAALDDPEGESAATPVFEPVFRIPDCFSKKPHEIAGDMPPAAPSTRRDLALAKGIATHAFLQYLPFGSGAEIQAAGELERAVESGLLSADDAHLINVDSIKRLLDSKLGSRLQSEGKATAEWRFFARLAAADVYANPRVLAALAGGDIEAPAVFDAGDFILLQGAVDLIFEDEHGRLIVDWKTDAVGDEYAKAHAKRYELQMFAYRYAVEKAFGHVESVNLAFIEPGTVVTVQ